VNARARGLMRTALAALTTGYLALALPTCDRKQEQDARIMTGGGESQRGPFLIRHYGCGSCHEIPGVPGAAAQVGPPLGQLLQRASLAGQLPNTGENLVRWIEHPQHHRPGGLMPEMNVGESDARDIAAYLYTQR
jgi:cytochrome c